jgi:hypothetical protein
MDRSLFPDGVIVEEGDLKHAETTKAYHIQRRLIDTAQSGRVQGLAVTQGVASTFTISVGRGYTPRGDLIEVTANPPTNVSLTGSEFLLGDYTNGAENLICLHYNEVKELPGSHETAGVSLPRRARGTYDVVVLTPARYDVLPPTSDLALNVAVSDAEYSRLSKDTLLVLAVATATGSGNALTIAVPRSLPADATVSFSGVGYSASILTASEATLSSPSSFIPAAVAGGTSLTIPIPGINLVSIQPVTSGGTPPFGVGYIQVNVSGSTKSVQWLEPSSNQTVGAAVTLNAGLGSQVITINGRASSHTSTLTVEVVHSLLPSANGTYRQYVIVEPLYAETAQVFSSRDEAHRDLKGSYVQTEANPHGLGFKDLAQSLAIVDQPLVLGSNQLSTEAAALVPRITTPVSTAANVDRTLLWLMDRGNYSIRFYRSAQGTLEVTSNASWDGLAWRADSTSITASRWEFSEQEIAYYTTSGLASSTITTFTLIHRFGGLPDFDTPLLTLGSGSLTPSRPRILLPVPNTGYTTLLATATSILSGVPNARLYFNDGLVNLTFNRYRNPTTSTWAPDNINRPQLMMNFDTDASAPLWSIEYILPSAPSTIRTLITADLLTGRVMVPGPIRLGGTTTPTSDTRIEFPTAFSPSGGWNRVLLETVTTSSVGATGNVRRYAATEGIGTYSEEAINCVWNGSSWSKDNIAYQSLLIRKGLDTGQITLFRAAGSGSWSEAQWSNQSGLSSVALSLAPSLNYPGTNTLNALNIPKAWGTISMPTDATVTLLEGFNVSSVSIGDALPQTAVYLQVNFVSALSTPNYVILLQDNTNRELRLSNPVAGDNGATTQMSKLYVHTKSTNYFRIRSIGALNTDADHIQRKEFDDNQPWGAGTLIDFVVFGQQ